MARRRVFSFFLSLSSFSSSHSAERFPSEIHTRGLEEGEMEGGG